MDPPSLPAGVPTASRDPVNGRTDPDFATPGLEEPASVGDIPEAMDDDASVDEDDLRRMIARERLRAEYLALRERNRVAQQPTVNDLHAGNTPGGMLGSRETSPAYSTATPSEGEEQAYRTRHSGGSKSRKQPDIPPFHGKDLHDAKLFLHRLELAFLNNEASFIRDKDKIVHALLWLKGDAEAKAMRVWNAGAIETGTWPMFKEFIMNTVTDPANRELTLMLRYEQATQGAQQSVSAFASQLDGLEKEFDESYTPTQSRRHLLAKLRPALRDAIVRQAYTPKSREELISLAERIENSMVGDRGAQPKRHASETHGNRAPKKPRAEDNSRDSGPNPATEKRPPPNPCAHCGGNHWNRDCTKRDAGGATVNRRVEISGKAKGPAKTRR
ncbi:MAG: Uncharacterized protein AUREO_004290 [Aureobasidium pullulans]|nr:MAG: Alpha/beta-hydrolase [Aureobasidium pullulans]OBW67167.1 MAG: Uncharacterized protein AUREO_027640 [Aureobasidium pullulans]OBW69516.1 MAG: Uncharacterized protein AUREO_004290 [Aureobasidium pullulans]